MNSGNMSGGGDPLDITTEELLNQLYKVENIYNSIKRKNKQGGSGKAEEKPSDSEDSEASQADRS